MPEDPQHEHGRQKDTAIGRNGRREAPVGWPEISYRELVERVPAVLYMYASDESSYALYMSPQTSSMFGYSREEWLETPDLWVKILHPNDRERVLASHERARLTGGSFEVEYRLMARDGSVVWVRDKATPVEDARDGGLGRRAGVLLDITDRKRYEEALKRSEERFRLVVEVTGEAIWDNDLLAGTQEWDGATEALFGYPPHQGRTGAWWEERVHPEDRGRVLSGLTSVLDGGGERWEDEYRFRRADGTYAQVADRGQVVRDEATGEAVRMVGAMADVTGRKEAEERARFLSELDRTLQPLIDTGEVMAAAARLLGEHLGADRCAYGEVDADEDQFRVTGDYTTEGVPSIIGRFAMSEFGSEALRLMRENEPYVVADTEADRRVVGADLAGYRRMRIRAAVTAPLHKGGRFVAGMAVHQQRPRRWTQEEVELVEAVTNRCWESLERARAVEELRESEERFRAAFEAAAVGMAHVATDGRWLEINGKLSEIVGYPREELLSLTFQDITHPDDLERDLKHVRRLLAGEIQTYSIEKRYVRKDGRRVWVNLTVSPVHAPSGEPDYFVSVVEDVTARKLGELVPDPLTPRELEVLRQIATSRTNKEAAESLSYSNSTVKLEVQHIIRKLGVENRWQAAIKAGEIGLV